MARYLFRGDLEVLVVPVLEEVLEADIVGTLLGCRGVASMSSSAMVPVSTYVPSRALLTHGVSELESTWCLENKVDGKDDSAV